jgi:Mrp family chromosome partitioning ATPase
VRPTSFPGLALLGSGRRDIRTPEHLTGARVHELFAELGAAFDIVIVDSAPLSAGVDALMLARATTNLLMVLRAGSTDLPSALIKLEATSTLPIHVVGAVLNDVRDREGFRGYGYDLSGYAVDDPALRAVAESQPRVLGGRP